MAVSEGAVQAAKDVLYYANPNDVERALTAALPFLPVQGAVKKLEWVATGQTGFLETEFYAVAGPLMHTVHPSKDVDGPFNEHYSIHRDWNDREIWRVTYYVGNNGLSGISKACKSLEAAKAAAQADFEARILSALEPSAARELALEALNIAYASMEGSCSANHRVALNTVDAAIRALSYPDHADAGKVERDGWMPIESAPKDGAEIIYLTKYGSIGFCRYAVDDINDWFGWWDLQADDEVYPRRWLPRSALPTPPSSEVA